LFEPFLLFILSIVTLKRTSIQRIGRLDDIFLKSKKLSFIVGFFIAITNPLIVFWWLAQIQLVKDFGIYHNFNTKAYVVYLVAGVFGLFSYLLLLSYMLHKVKHFISKEIERRINLVMDFILIFIDVYFFIRTLKLYV
jgi:threonine/homoserine/homoserine lactone efflux protein